MATLFTSGLLIYYWLALRRYAKNGAVLAMLLWALYVCLGLSGMFLQFTGGIKPIFEPDYSSTLLLLTSIIISISGFLRFRSEDISQMFGRIRGQVIIENILITSQILAIIFFLPFAINALTGDVNENRLLLVEDVNGLGSYGLINTMAGAASQLFSSSLIFAFFRLVPEKSQGRNVPRAFFLFLSSFSYVIYILAYVGRDGVVYWAMTAVMVFLIFHRHLTPIDIRNIILFGFSAIGVILVPFVLITISRFFDNDQGAGWSFFEYFGAQIHNFSDYSSIDRPITLGIQNFPMFINAGCTIFGIDCLSWLDIKDVVFTQYLDQGKVPWAFGTFVSDFAADFGNIGALIIISIFSIFCRILLPGQRSKNSLSLTKLLLILFLFLVPYWGVFYFRFSIINGYIVVNIVFIMFVALLNKINFRSS